MKFQTYYNLESKKSSIISERRLLFKIDNKPISVLLKDINIIGTTHGLDRLDRPDQEGKITEAEVTDTLNKALPKILSDFANGEIENNAEFHIKNLKTDLNIIGTLDMVKGPDQIRIITVMKKKDFWTKSNTYTYEV